MQAGGNAHQVAVDVGVPPGVEGERRGHPVQTDSEGPDGETAGQEGRPGEELPTLHEPNLKLSDVPGKAGSGLEAKLLGSGIECQAEAWAVEAAGVADAAFPPADLVGVGGTIGLAEFRCEFVQLDGEVVLGPAAPNPRLPELGIALVLGDRSPLAHRVASLILVLLASVLVAVRYRNGTC